MIIAIGKERIVIASQMLSQEGQVVGTALKSLMATQYLQNFHILSIKRICTLETSQKYMTD
jgi:hypothetical protein